MDYKTSIAFHSPSGKFKHVKEVNNGLSCQCICNECKGVLESVQSKNPLRKWYFRHYNKSNCKGGFESALHKYAKQLIVESHSLVYSEQVTIIYKQAFSEESVESYRPDVTIISEDQGKIYIEVFVSNAVKEIKRDYFIDNKLKSFEINLSDILDKNQLIDLPDLKKRILLYYNNRVPLYWPKLQLSNNNGSNGIVSLLGATSIIIGIYYLLFKVFKKRNRKH